MKANRQIFLLITVIVLIFFGGFFLYQEYYEHQARQKYTLVKEELKRLQPLPNAVSTWAGDTVAAHHVTAGQLYRTDLPFNDVKTYYDSELAKHGYRLQEESEAYGRRQISYSKGELTAFIDYAGENNPEYTYYFRVSWDSL